MSCAKLIFIVLVLRSVVAVYSDYLINVGNNSVVTYDTVGTYNHLYGDNITALVGSTICLDATVPTSLKALEKFYFNGVELEFIKLFSPSYKAVYIANGLQQIEQTIDYSYYRYIIIKQLICIYGYPANTYSGLYSLFRREKNFLYESNVTSYIHFIGNPPNFEEIPANVLFPHSNGILGNTFIITEFGNLTITITATDIAGDPKGTISWSFTGVTGVRRAISSNAQYNISSTVAGVSVLVISDFVKNDLGIYTATAINLLGRDTASALTIMGTQAVFPTPTPPLVTVSSISSSTNKIWISFNVDVFSEEFSIDAIDLVSFPRGTVTWHYSLIPDNNPPLLQITGAFEVTDQTPAGNSGSGSNLRFVNGIADASALGYYTANSSNMFGTARATSIVGRPPLLRTSNSGDIGNDYGATIGGSLIITTKDMQGFPEGRISWFRIVNGAAIHISTGGKYTVGTDSNKYDYLTITGITSDDLETYRATATNVFGENSAESKIESLPRIDFVSGSQVVAHSGGEYKVGANIILNSFLSAFTLTANDIHGVPTGNITWKIIFYAFKGNKLKFNDVDRRVFGTYGVTATNKYGTDQRDFNIRAAPKLDSKSGFVEIINATSDIKIKIGTSASTQPGTTVRLNAVDMFGIPTGTITWRKDSVELFVTTNVLTIRNIGASDYGTYTATATNEWGTSSAISVIRQGDIAPKFKEISLLVNGSGNLGDVFFVPIGSQITIVSRDIQGFPLSAITWTRIVGFVLITITNSTPGYTIVNTVENGFSVSTLTTTSSTSTFGIYYARASNRVGEDSAKIQVKKGNHWCTGEWSECSNNSCTGQRSRNVVCCEDGNPDLVLLDTDCNPNTKPLSIEGCGPIGNCSWLYSWHRGALTPCIAACEPGTQTRPVTCHRKSDGLRIDSSRCDPSRKPIGSFICRVKSYN